MTISKFLLSRTLEETSVLVKTAMLECLFIVTLILIRVQAMVQRTCLEGLTWVTAVTASSTMTILVLTTTTKTVVVSTWLEWTSLLSSSTSHPNTNRTLISSKTSKKTSSICSVENNNYPTYTPTHPPTIMFDISSFYYLNQLNLYYCLTHSLTDTIN